VALQSTRNKYTYRKLSELLEPEKKVNIYGVINTIVKVTDSEFGIYCVQLVNNIAVWFESATAGNVILGSRIVRLIQ
jgi:hypothetical protein